MIIKSLPGFTGNGILKGTFVALDDEGDPLGWEEYGNWSSSSFVGKAVSSLAEATGVPKDQARMLLTEAIRQGRRKVGTDPLPSPSIEPEGERTRIVVNGRYLRDLATDSWAVIVGAGDQPEFFMVGDALAHLEFARERVYPRVLRKEALIHHLDLLADYMTVKDGVFTPSFPPKAVAEDMLSTARVPVPSLQGVVNTPVVSANGTVITTEGYHPEVELYLDFKGLEMPTVPSRPLASDIERARTLLLDELLCDFPFATLSDKTHIVAAMITPFVRPMVDGPTPLFLIEAPSPGTGKGLLVEVVVAVTTGGAPAVMTEGRGTEEWRKRLTATLMETPTVVLIDNIQSSLDSAPLAAALTARIWQDRELGATRIVRLPVRCMWLATGNNVSLSAEIARRTVRSRIDSSIERPWERSDFKHDPLMPWVYENRGELCWSIMTLIRAWVAKGRPEPSVRMGSFDEWTRVVGGILQTAGIPGFLENRSAVYAQAEAEVEVWAAFIDVWRERFGNTRVTVHDLYDLARESKLLADLRGGRTDKGARVSLGLSLASMRDRRVGDYWIRDVGTGHGGGRAYTLQSPDELGDWLKKPSPLSPPTPENGASAVTVGGGNSQLSPEGQAQAQSSLGFDGDSGDSSFNSYPRENFNFSETPCTCDIPYHPENGADVPVCSVCGSRSWCLTCFGCVGCKVLGP